MSDIFTQRQINKIEFMLFDFGDSLRVVATELNRLTGAGHRIVLAEINKIFGERIKQRKSKSSSIIKYNKQKQINKNK
jgi:hypothetical protein